MTGAARRHGRWQHPLWAAAFRPFLLAGACYAPLLALLAIAVWAGVLPTATMPPLWHGHEMVFGFAGAIVAGIVLTALPGWAGIPETEHAPLALLAALWVLGRAAFWLQPSLPLAVVGAVALPVALALWLAPHLWPLPRRAWRLVLAILPALALADAVHHAALAAGDAALAATALRGAVWVLMLLFVLAGGLLTPVFTGNALRAAGRGDVAPAWPLLDAAAAIALVALALLDLTGAGDAAIGAAAIAALLLQGWRVARWRGWRVLDAPLVPGLHGGFAWLLLALALRAGAALGAPWPADAWMHAFTVGALGQTMLSLMTRVALRHTGRTLALPAPLRWTAWAVAAAAALRVAVALGAAPAAAAPVLLAAALALWGAAFGAWAVVLGPRLLSPSLPRGAPPS
ncbi:MAG: NnrS family protein [Burkholderiales bacterium]|nr:NnrS family protein [Burkholderiales bacterium]